VPGHRVEFSFCTYRFCTYSRCTASAEARAACSSAVSSPCELRLRISLSLSLRTASFFLFTTLVLLLIHIDLHLLRPPDFTSCVLVKNCVQESCRYGSYFFFFLASECFSLSLFFVFVCNRSRVRQIASRLSFEIQLARIVEPFGLVLMNFLLSACRWLCRIP